MSKDYRYQREELESVEEEFHAKRMHTKRHQGAKAKHLRALQRKEKQRRLFHEGV